MTARQSTPAALVEAVAFEEGFGTIAEIAAGMLVEFTNLRFETPAQQRKLGGVWKVTDITAGTRGRAASLKVTNPTGSVYRGVSPGMVKATALTWPEVTAAPLHLGSVVRFTPEGVTANRGKFADDLFVVIKDSVTDVNLAKLGGDGNRYLRTVAKARLALVTGETVTLP